MQFWFSKIVAISWWIARSIQYSVTIYRNVKHMFLTS
nr:MAG TPA: hypothetical protein [Caudoviricetes sp.]